MLCEVLHKEMLDQLREHVKRSPSQELVMRFE